MVLWRLSTPGFARVFDGGYGLLHDGRWNTRGHAVTYCASSPALCVLEKLVHIEDPTLMPDLVLVAYDVPDDLTVETIHAEDFAGGWIRDDAATQGAGDRWHAARTSPILRVPSVIVPIAGSPDANFVVNHAHPDASRIGIRSEAAFALDSRLL